MKRVSKIKYYYNVVTSTIQTDNKHQTENCIYIETLAANQKPYYIQNGNICRELHGKEQILISVEKLIQDHNKKTISQLQNANKC
jgi:hypothetical protein